MSNHLVTLTPEIVGRLPRISDYFGVWAIEESRFDSSIAIFDRINLSDHILANAGFQSRDGRAPNSSEKSYTIGRIDLTGTLMKSESSMDESTSTVRARRAMRSLADDTRIDGIIQVIDSPGGTVAGTQDYAVEARRAATMKPLVTFFEDLGASAAYWVGSVASRIFANESALVGSIGTLLVVQDFAKRAETLGVKVHVLKRGDLKGTGVPGTEITEAQLTYLDGLVGSLDSIFKEEVSKARGLSLSAINDLQARVMPAKEALSVGLIDEIGNYHDAINSLVTLIDKRKSGKSATASAVLSSSTLANFVSVSQKQESSSMNLDDPVTLETLEQMCPGASAEFCMTQLKAKATIGQAIKAHSESLVKSRDEAIAKAVKPEVAAQPAKLSGAPAALAAGGIPTSTEEAGDFDSLVRQYMRDNPTKNRHEAVVVTVRRHPEAHKSYLLAHPKNQLRQIKTKIESRDEISQLMNQNRRPRVVNS